MTTIAVGVLLALAAVSLGLRVTALLMPRVPPLVRLVASILIGTILVTATMQVCDRYGVHDLGLGLLMSLAPVGIFDLAKWWFREKTVSAFSTIDHAEARRLIADGAVTILDVRTPGEFERLGHIPGAWLIPVDLVASAPSVLPNDAKPVLVYCEHGVRSVAASRLLAAAGLDQVLNLAGGLAHWSGPREFGAGVVRGPSPWLIENADLLPRGGRVLDVACGRGRHALLMASAGFEVRALDRNPEAIAFVRDTAGRLSLPIDASVVDLETEPPPLIPADFDAILVFNYLHRPLMPALRAAVKPDGRIFYETFTTRQAERGHPTNPAFLLNDGELAELMAPLAVLRSREGEFDGRFLASIVAERRGKD